jgi:hypothetical protein
MNFGGCPRSRVELFEKSHGMGNFYKIFGDGFWGSFTNIFCEFGDCLFLVGILISK